MAKQRAGDTREKLLTAASEVFVEKGFRDATVAEICNRAAANVAAVNYHFGSKEALYRETWRHSFAASIKAHPQNGGVSAEAPAEERLRGQVKALIDWVADEYSRDFFISQREFVSPTGLLSEVMKSEMIPLRQQTLSLIRELLGPEATEQQTVFCEMCLISMCLHPMLIQRIRKRTQDAGTPTAIDDLTAFTDYVIKFSLAGIAATKG
jgi:AcrR family transcriptional regulator